MELLITTPFWQTPRGKAAFCGNSFPLSLTFPMPNIDSYYECCQTRRTVQQIQSGRSAAAALADVRSGIKGTAGLFGDEIHRFYKTVKQIKHLKWWKQSWQNEDESSHRMVPRENASDVSVWFTSFLFIIFIGIPKFHSPPPLPHLPSMQTLMYLQLNISMLINK